MISPLCLVVLSLRCAATAGATCFSSFPSLLLMSRWNFCTEGGALGSMREKLGPCKLSRVWQMIRIVASILLLSSSVEMGVEVVVLLPNSVSVWVK